MLLLSLKRTNSQSHAHTKSGYQSVSLLVEYATFEFATCSPLTYRIRYLLHPTILSKKNFYGRPRKTGSTSVSERLPNYPSPSPTLTLTFYQLTVVGLGEG